MKTIIWTIVIIIIAGGVFFFVKNENKERASGDNIGVMNPEAIDSNSSIDSQEVDLNEISDPEKIEDDKNEAPPVDSIESESAVTHTVVYKNSGFEPKEITIKKGEFVTFLNQSESGMWVGSALHPTHELYPEKSESDCLGSSFDQCEASDPGVSWAFQFNALGEHGYHNHVRANHWGKVIVE